MDIHESHRERYQELKDKYSELGRARIEVLKEMTNLERSCRKCGEFITDDCYDWDYEDNGEEDDDEYDSWKVEFTICPKCGNKEITNE